MANKLKTLEEIRQEVEKWSRANFGLQETKYLTIKEDLLGVTVCLGSLAPLMGIVEEYGEYLEAKIAWNNAESDSQAYVAMEQMCDAIGDMLIYLCDFASREGIRLVDYERFPTTDPRLVGVHLGRLYHIMLKRLQGIRGYDDNAKFVNERGIAILNLWGSIQGLAVAGFMPDGLTARRIANDTWGKVVSKRNWKENPEEGVSQEEDDEDDSEDPIDAIPHHRPGLKETTTKENKEFRTFIPYVQLRSPVPVDLDTDSMRSSMRSAFEDEVKRIKAQCCLELAADVNVVHPGYVLLSIIKAENVAVLFWMADRSISKERMLELLDPTRLWNRQDCLDAAKWTKVSDANWIAVMETYAVAISEKEEQNNEKR